MSRRRNKGGRIPPMLLLNSPYSPGSVPTPRMKGALRAKIRAKSRNVAGKIRGWRKGK